MSDEFTSFGLPTGSTSGTVAAGDDVRIVGMVSATGAFPSDAGYMGWSADPILASAGALASTSGTVYVARIHLQTAGPISKVWLSLGAVAVTPTSGQNFVAVFDSSGARLGVSADLSGSLGTTAVNGFSLATPTASQSAGTVVYASWLFNATTPPTLARIPTGASPAANLTPSSYRWATVSTGQTSIPTTFTPGSLSAGTVGQYWVAVS